MFNLYPDQPSKTLDEPAINGVNVNALQFEASVMDGPVVNTRAGLYVYINSMVRPFCFVVLVLLLTDGRLLDAR